MLQPRRRVPEHMTYAQTQRGDESGRRRRIGEKDALVDAIANTERLVENRQPAAKAMPPRERVRRIGLSARGTDSHRRVIGLSARGTDAHPPRPENQDLQPMLERKRKRKAAYLEAEAMHAATTIDVDECLRLSLHTRGLSPPTPKGEDEVLVAHVGAFGQVAQLHAVDFGLGLQLLEQFLDFGRLLLEHVPGIDHLALLLEDVIQLLLGMRLGALGFAAALGAYALLFGALAPLSRERTQS